MNNDLISREALKRKAYTAVILEPDEKGIDYVKDRRLVVDLDDINNAPTIETKECPLRGFARVDKNGDIKIELLEPQGEWIEFADYVARNVVSEDFSEDVDFYAEVLCRKLVKLGLVKLDGDTYKYCGTKMKGDKE